MDSLQSVSVIDFADVSIGDPVYDFVALYLSTLECSPDLMNTFLTSYTASAPQGSWAYRSLPLSFVAMCYTLLHPELALLSAFNQV